MGALGARTGLPPRRHKGCTSWASGGRSQVCHRPAMGWFISAWTAHTSVVPLHLEGTGAVSPSTPDTTGSGSTARALRRCCCGHRLGL